MKIAANGEYIANIVVNPELEAHIPALKADEFSQLEHNIIAEGCREPILLRTGTNEIVDGHNRYRICTKNGLPFQTSYMTFATIDDVKAWMEDNQLGRRNLTPENFSYYLGRKYARLKKAQGAQTGNDNSAKQRDQNDPVVSTASQIAADHSVSAATVKRAEKFAKAVDKIGEKLGAEAKQKLLSGEIDAKRSTIEKAAEIVADAVDGGMAMTVEKAVAIAEGHAPAANDNKPLAAYRTSFTGDNEWYTPARYVELARTVMGQIDVDPASNDFAQKTVKASTFYTAETNGLDKEWLGRVWMNPPYSQPDIVYFIEKLIAEYEAGRCTEAIVLTHNSTDTAWFDALFKNADAICFTKGRVRFVSPTGEFAAPAMGQAFTYFGAHPTRFLEVFSEVGNVWGPKWRLTA